MIKPFTEPQSIGSFWDTESEGVGNRERYRKYGVTEQASPLLAEPVWQRECL